MGEERYLEWLERLEIPVEDTVSIGAFQSYLEDILGFIPTDAQLDALWGGTEYRYEVLAPSGIRPMIITYPWGKDTRYFIEDFPGLWGFEGMKSILDMIYAYEVEE